jgi:hypothetical protein
MLFEFHFFNGWEKLCYVYWICTAIVKYGFSMGMDWNILPSFIYKIVMLEKDLLIKYFYISICVSRQNSWIWFLLQ